MLKPWLLVKNNCVRCFYCLLPLIFLSWLRMLRKWVHATAVGPFEFPGKGESFWRCRWAGQNENTWAPSMNHFLWLVPPNHLIFFFWYDIMIWWLYFESPWFTFIQRMQISKQSFMLTNNYHLQFSFLLGYGLIIQSNLVKDNLSFVIHKNFRYSTNPQKNYGI